ncbi:hypothetical protein [Sinorhizobium sp. BG8]|uniref:hypothetical protein n=1 Tax=Sinorhizobium sp. BG8 TaxID=2613773 RepID=UPI00193DF018|nr:hypothetical protein [Sinorhizobium sp. BG8]QRM57179.1 hypothetical protein F3Y30_21910 [Sinorhizobium sp. BG8]
MTSNWQRELRMELAALVDKAVVAGAEQTDVYAAVMKEIERLRIANDRDPDPADDVSEQDIQEPANDWPAAER